MRNPIIFKVVPVLFFAATHIAQAGVTLTFSDFSSDETPAQDLAATLEFTIDGGTLVLTATNTTPIDVGFDITAVYFNALSHVTGLSMATPVEGWLLFENRHADGFGRFGFGLLTEDGNDPFELGPQQSQTFRFDISGNGPFDADEFVLAMSIIPPGHISAIAAIKFANGPGDDSAFGAVVPEPATLLLLMVGLGVVGLHKRRR